MANIEYIQNAINRFMGDEKNEFLLEQKGPDSNETAIGRLVSGCVTSPTDISFGQGVESALSSFGQTHEGSSLVATV